LEAAEATARKLLIHVIGELEQVNSVYFHAVNLPFDLGELWKISGSFLGYSQTWMPPK